MSKWFMRAHFRHLHFDKFSMIQRMPQWEVFWPLKLNYEVLGVSVDYKVPISGVWESSSHFSNNRVATFKFEILIFGQKMKVDINNLEFIYLPIMDEFHPIICLFNPNHTWNSSMQKWHSSMDIFIHVSGLKSN
jgi:hypothetical protein